MSSEYVGTLERQRTSRRPLRVLVIEAIGPLTILAGFVWGVAQPYRIAFVDPAGKGVYDFLFQPPLLVAAVGVFFTLVIAPGVLEDLREDDGPAS